MEDFRRENEKMFEAKEIMKERFFGRREIEKALEIKIDPERIPEIPFSREELERAFELNQFLILRVDKTADEKKITIENINKLLKGRLEDGGKILYESDKNGHIDDSTWFLEEEFATGETPRLAWALTGREVIPDSNGKNYLKQTEGILKYLKNEVFSNVAISEEVNDLILEFENKKVELERQMKACGLVGGLEEASQFFKDLKITKKMRPSPVEIVYDYCVYAQNKGERILSGDFKETWTSGVTSESRFVKVKNTGKDGLDLSSLSPEGSNEKIGAILSRV